jgi:hypothetical protein
MTTAHDPSTYAKIVGVIKDLPLWMFMAFAVASAILLFVPQVNNDLPADFKPWLILSFVVFGVMSIFKWIDLIAGAVHSWRVESKASKTFHMTPVTQHCWWAVAKQADGSFVTQIVADFSVKNQSTKPVGLMRARIIKPLISGQVIHDMITVREQRGRMHGTAYVSDYRIAPGTALPARVMVMIVGKPRKSENEDLEVTFGISDEDGHELKVKVLCRGQQKPTATQLPIALEAIHAITDPIEKAVASVLQTEISRYELNGRQSGGLGSISVINDGAEIKSFAGDARLMQNTGNQEMVEDPTSTTLKSDTLDALLALHTRLTSEDEKQVFANALLSRLKADTGYGRVAYLIVATLWKIGLLREALEAALLGLPANDQREHALSNSLMLLNGLLSYQHHLFSSATLDEIERFLQGSPEHSLRIPQKIASIRAQRVLAGL